MAHGSCLKLLANKNAVKSECCSVKVFGAWFANACAGLFATASDFEQDPYLFLVSRTSRALCVSEHLHLSAPKRVKSNFGWDFQWIESANHLENTEGVVFIYKHTTNPIDFKIISKHYSGFNFQTDSGCLQAHSQPVRKAKR